MDNVSSRTSFSLERAPRDSLQLQSSQAGLFLGRYDLAAIILPAGPANMVRTLEFAAIRTFDLGLWHKPVMRAAHIAPGRRGFSLGDRHDKRLLGLCAPVLSASNGKKNACATLLGTGPGETGGE
jgi:hypothetical protein